MRLVDYKIFPNQAFNAEVDVTKEVIMAKSQPIDLRQAVEDSNWLATMQEEIRAIEKKERPRNSWTGQVRSQLP